MEYFFDTEFHEDDRTIELISIGIVAEDGRELYACNADADLRRVWADPDPFHRNHVLPQLPPLVSGPWMRRAQIREAIVDFMLAPLPLQPWAPTPLRKTLDGKKIELWGYYSATDWVVFYQLFGRMMDLPPQFPKRCNDLKQWSDAIGALKFPKPKEGVHNALTDARWNRDLRDYLTKFEIGRR